MSFLWLSSESIKGLLENQYSPMHKLHKLHEIAILLLNVEYFGVIQSNEEEKQKRSTEFDSWLTNTEQSSLKELGFISTDLTLFWLQHTLSIAWLGTIWRILPNCSSIILCISLHLLFIEMNTHKRSCCLCWSVQEWCRHSVNDSYHLPHFYPFHSIHFSFQIRFQIL